MDEDLSQENNSKKKLKTDTSTLPTLDARSTDAAVLVLPEFIDLCTPSNTVIKVVIPTEDIQNQSVQNVTVERFPNLTRRRSILPLYPNSQTSKSEGDPLFTNIPVYQLTPEEVLHRSPNACRSAFDIINHDPTVPSFLRAKYELFFGDLIRRLKVDMTILDFNYTRLDHYMKRLIEEQIQVFTLRPDEIPRLDEREYPLALEFFLQFDVNMFYMKTCPFRFARPRSLHEGLFCIQEPEARYELTECGNCGLCYPQYDMTYRTKKCVVEFSQAHKHTLVNGYQVILNCSAHCHTQNIIYALTCPCGQVDYIGSTAQSLHDRLKTHREHGNRIMHEFLLGQKNIMRDRPQPKTDSIRRKDRMKLYQHSARCPVAMQIFLDANPQYWRFVPMTMNEAEQTEQQAVQHLHVSDESHPRVRPKEDCRKCIEDVPRPPTGYAFSNRQIALQAQYFHQKRDEAVLNDDINLYNATIVAVLPETCSDMFRYVIESFFITYGETSLNTIGNVLNEAAQRHYYPLNDPWLLRGDDWCQGLLRRPKPRNKPT